MDLKELEDFCTLEERILSEFGEDSNDFESEDSENSQGLTTPHHQNSFDTPFKSPLSATKRSPYSQNRYDDSYEREKRELLDMLKEDVINYRKETQYAKAQTKVNEQLRRTLESERRSFADKMKQEIETAKTDEFKKLRKEFERKEREQTTEIIQLKNEISKLKQSKAQLTQHTNRNLEQIEKEREARQEVEDMFSNYKTENEREKVKTKNELRTTKTKLDELQKENTDLKRQIQLYESEVLRLTEENERHASTLTSKQQEEAKRKEQEEKRRKKEEEEKKKKDEEERIRKREEERKRKEEEEKRRKEEEERHKKEEEKRRREKEAREAEERQREKLRQEREKEKEQELERERQAQKEREAAAAKASKASEALRQQAPSEMFTSQQNALLQSLPSVYSLPFSIEDIPRKHPIMLPTLLSSHVPSLTPKSSPVTSQFLRTLLAPIFTALKNSSRTLGDIEEERVIRMHNKPSIPQQIPRPLTPKQMNDPLVKVRGKTKKKEEIYQSGRVIMKFNTGVTKDVIPPGLNVFEGIIDIYPEADSDDESEDSTGDDQDGNPDRLPRFKELQLHEAIERGCSIVFFENGDVRILINPPKDGEQGQVEKIYHYFGNKITEIQWINGNQQFLFESQQKETVFLPPENQNSVWAKKEVLFNDGIRKIHMSNDDEIAYFPDGTVQLDIQPQNAPEGIGNIMLISYYEPDDDRVDAAFDPNAKSHQIIEIQFSNQVKRTISSKTHALSTFDNDDLLEQIDENGVVHVYKQGTSLSTAGSEARLAPNHQKLMKNTPNDSSSRNLQMRGDQKIRMTIGPKKG
ncbi:hypothetical protein BLNAU_4660 [Blattamonas nauphoetae]|uniref:Uncharacterized protein n=1 Tax=Blattamonas nauphoetae TaxID=2049346 RepID=A0ABQ9Y9S1_9EUKA|nr:hypothetical protein BLNAU_4660 [Blattamonas nauphoetae]